MKNRRLDELLQEQFVYDGPSKLRYEALNEEQQNRLTKGLVDASMRVILEKSKNLDYSLIEATRGSIKKVHSINNIIGAIQGMKNVQSQCRAKIYGLDVVDAALNNLILKEELFKRAFATDCSLVKLLYNNIGIALIISTAAVVSNGVDIVKESSGLTRMVVSSRSSKVLDMSMLKSLEKFNKMCANGDIDRFIRKVLPETQSIAADGILGMSSLFGGFTLLAAGGIAFVIIATIIMLRQIVYGYYNMRVKLSDYLRVNAEFVEMNQSKLTMMGDMEGTKRKQEAAAKRLIELADKIDVDQKVSSKRTAIDIKEINNKVEVDNRDTNDDILF